MKFSVRQRDGVRRANRIQHEAFRVDFRVALAQRRKGADRVNERIWAGTIRFHKRRKRTVQ